jgi:DNA-binding beta-propeller fold protein YncE
VRVRQTHWAILILLALAGCDSATSSSPASATGRLYVTSGATDEVFLIDPTDGRTLKSFSLDVRRDEIDEPHGIEVAPDGSHWYATVSHGDPTLWKFELPGDRLVGRVALGTYGAARIGITPDGQRGFIPDYYRSGQGQLSGLAVVDLFDLEIIARPTICPAPHDAQVDPAGQLVAIACTFSDEIVLLDAETLQEVDRFFVDEQPGPAGTPRFKPLNLVWSPDGATLYVALHLAGAVRAYDLQGNVLATATVGAGPTQIALAPDGMTLVTANRDDQNVSILDLPALTERQRVPLAGAHPHGVVIDPAGGIAYVTYEGDIQSPGGVVAIQLAAGTVLWSAEVGAYTLGVTFVYTRTDRVRVRIGTVGPVPRFNAGIRAAAKAVFSAIPALPKRE